MDVTVIVYNRNYAFAQSGRLVIALWRGTTTAAAVDKGWELLNDRLDRTAPLHLLTIIESRAPLPDAEARRKLTRFLAMTEYELACSRVVVEAEGFRGATIRALVGGITLLAQPAFPHHVFADIASAAQHIEAKPPRGGPAMPADEVLTMIDAVRRYPAKAPNFAWRQRPSEPPRAP